MKIMIRRFFSLLKVNIITRFCVLSSMTMIIILWLSLIHIIFLSYNCFKVFSISCFAASELFKAVISCDHFVTDDREIDIIWLLITELEKSVDNYKVVRIIRLQTLLSEIKVSNKLIDDLEFKISCEERLLSRSDFKSTEDDAASE